MVLQLKDGAAHVRVRPQTISWLPRIPTLCHLVSFNAQIQLHPRTLLAPEALRAGSSLASLAP